MTGSCSQSCHTFLLSVLLPMTASAATAFCTPLSSFAPSFFLQDCLSLASSLQVLRRQLPLLLLTRTLPRPFLTSLLIVPHSCRFCGGDFLYSFDQDFASARVLVFTAGLLLRLVKMGTYSLSRASLLVLMDAFAGAQSGWWWRAWECTKGSCACVRRAAQAGGASSEPVTDRSITAAASVLHNQLKGTLHCCDDE